MRNSETNKTKSLGMNYSTASQQLQRRLLFDMARRLGETRCFRCGVEIGTISDLSVDHKLPWMLAEDPKISFFDLTNIAFSHFKCNSKAASKPGRIYRDKEHRRAMKAKRRMSNPERREELLRRKREYATRSAKLVL